ncbi:MAG: YbhB/YbcL family Raf kinase inhibitor-like protein [Leptolyngbyaceae cyanobacterium]
MVTRRFVTLGLLGGVLAACATSPGQAERRDSNLNQEAVPSMKLESRAFTANATIPQQYTCDGQDLSPPLQWDTPPPGTQSLVLITDDPDAPRGTFVHWVLYNLSPDQRGLTEGASSAQPTLANGAFQGRSDFGKLGYGGPCPPSGSHRYFFKLYALDTRLTLQPGDTKAQVERAMQGHILDQAELMGYYTRSR